MPLCCMCTITAVLRHDELLRIHRRNSWNRGNSEKTSLQKDMQATDHKGRRPDFHSLESICTTKSPIRHVPNRVSLRHRSQCHMQRAIPEQPQPRSTAELARGTAFLTISASRKPHFATGQLLIIAPHAPHPKW